MISDVLTKIANERKELLSLPQTLAEVLRLVRDDRSSADELAKVLIKDPALTAKILRIVNSAFYGGGRNVGSMSQAVITLGVRQITALTLSASVYNLTAAWDSSLDRVRFWRHSLEVAIASQLIAEKIGYSRVEEAFVAGLLHDIGLLILDHSFSKEYSLVWRRAGWDAHLIDCEEEVFYTNHAKVAQFLLDQWRLPETICQAVGSHHIVFVRGTDAAELTLNQIVCLANNISRFRVADRPQADAGLENENLEILRDNLGLTKEQLFAIERELLDRTVEQAKYLEMDIGSIESILTEANRLLFEQYVTVESLLNENRQMRHQIVRDQIQTVSLSSLKSRCARLARYLSDAATGVEKNTDDIADAMQSAHRRRTADGRRSSTEVIIRGVQALRSVAAELKRISEADAESLADESNFPDIDDQIRPLLESIQEVAY